MHQTVFASLLIHMMAGMAGTVEERRIDPYDSQSCTLDEVKKKHSLLSEVEILDYWESEMTLDPKQKACKPADAPPVADGENSQDLQRLARLRNLQTVAADNSKQDAIKPGNPPPDERREDPQDGNIYKVENIYMCVSATCLTHPYSEYKFTYTSTTPSHTLTFTRFRTFSRCHVPN